MAVPLLADALLQKSAQQRIAIAHNARMHHPRRDALQELWITRCIGWAPLATMHPARFGLPDPLEGLSGWLGGDYDAQDIFIFLKK